MSLHSFCTESLKSGVYFIRGELFKLACPHFRHPVATWASGTVLGSAALRAGSPDSLVCTGLLASGTEVSSLYTRSGSVFIIELM